VRQMKHLPRDPFLKIPAGPPFLKCRLFISLIETCSSVYLASRPRRECVVRNAGAGIAICSCTLVISHYPHKSMQNNKIQMTHVCEKEKIANKNKDKDVAK